MNINIPIIAEIFGGATIIEGSKLKKNLANTSKLKKLTKCGEIQKSNSVNINKSIGASTASWLQKILFVHFLKATNNVRTCSFLKKILMKL